ncbi:MAG: alpha/beta fold hydrolase [Patescibacteria group bacterium]
MEKIQFLVDGQKISGTYFEPSPSRQKFPGVIFFHGMTSSQKNYLPLAQKLTEQGIAGLSIDLRGHGASEGDFAKLTIADGVRDGLTAYDFLANQKGIDTERIGLCGSSFGGTIASLIARKRKVASLVLRAPAAYPNDMVSYTQIMEKEEIFFQTMKKMEETTAIQAMSTFTGRLLVVISEKDTVIPERMCEAYLSQAVAAKQKEASVIKESSHSLDDPAWREEFNRLSVQWFKKTLY